MLEHRNDLYLSELKEWLSEACGVTVNETTIWQALRCSGFRMKRVCCCIYLSLCYWLRYFP
jgi:hypothetical protein